MLFPKVFKKSVRLASVPWKSGAKESRVNVELECTEQLAEKLHMCRRCLCEVVPLHCAEARSSSFLLPVPRLRSSGQGVSDAS